MGEISDEQWKLNDGVHLEVPQRIFLPGVAPEDKPGVAMVCGATSKHVRATEV